LKPGYGPRQKCLLRAPHPTTCDFFIFSDVKGLIYVSSLLPGSEEVKDRICDVLEAVTKDVL